MWFLLAHEVSVLIPTASKTLELPCIKLLTSNCYRKSKKCTRGPAIAGLN